MGREIRQVPPDWEHPVNGAGHFQPMFDRTHLKAICGHIVDSLPWYVRHPVHFAEWLNMWPDKAYHRPCWRKGEATCHQVYETVSEGTPTSPVFETLDEVEGWLVEQGHSKHAAKVFCERRWAPSFMMFVGPGDRRQFASGIDYADLE